MEIDHGPRNRDAVALTFHGAGTPTLTRDVLRELDRAGAPVTVLAVGTWLTDHPGVARRILDGGHELGNHTQHHLPMRELPPHTAYREVEECARTLRRLTGSAGRWFRASGTQRTTHTIRRAAGRAGYATCLSYDVDSLDWTDPSADAIATAVLSGARRGSIVSMHLGHAGTVAALPRVVEGLRRRGLRPVTVSELLA